jgi:hypothetical protein
MRHSLRDETKQKKAQPALDLNMPEIRDMKKLTLQPPSAAHRIY